MREKEEKDVYFFTGGAGGEGCKREREREKEILLNIFLFFFGCIPHATRWKVVL